MDAALRFCGVSCSQSNFDFACCPDAMQKTDSEMSEDGDECKPQNNHGCSFHGIGRPRPLTKLP